MKFYLQVRCDGIITDAIDYPFDNYIEYEADMLPVGINGGWFKLENGMIVEYPGLKQINEVEDFQALREQVATQEQAILELSMMIKGVV